LSVIVCTYNPRAHYLDRVLVGLRRQTLSFQRWELLLIDNASKVSVADRFDIGWHPNGRHVREDELGLTPARLRGIAEGVAELLLFVDDDNVLDPDYLEQALRIGQMYPLLGTWGGQCIPEYEVEPAPELKPYLPSIAVWTTDRDSWTNLAGWSEAYPYGAGMCVRRGVMAEVRRQTTACRLRQSLERKGQVILSGGDYDVNLTACDMGLGCGVFHLLKLTHLIPAYRVKIDYMLKINYVHSYSSAVLFTARGKPPSDPLPTPFKRLLWKARLRRHPYPQRAFIWADMTGTHDGVRFCQQTRTTATASPTLAKLSELLPESIGHT
jgi:glycosyltransferase involved in cell wall biosynthesis